MSVRDPPDRSMLMNENLRTEVPMAPLPRPTDAELAILRVLWSRGRATVREVHQALYPADEAIYNTTLKLLLVMHEKGLVVREAAGRSHIYASTEAPETTQRQLVKDMLGRAFGGDARAFVLSALEEDVASDSDLDAIEAALAEARRVRKGGL